MTAFVHSTQKSSAGLGNGQGTRIQVLMPVIHSYLKNRPLNSATPKVLGYKY